MPLDECGDQVSLPHPLWKAHASCPPRIGQPVAPLHSSTKRPVHVNILYPTSLLDASGCLTHCIGLTPGARRGHTAYSTRVWPDEGVEDGAMPGVGMSHRRSLTDVVPSVVQRMCGHYVIRLLTLEHRDPVSFSLELCYHCSLSVVVGGY
jgi:hypothetical protein